ncbi:hypothetical protein D9V30_00690 [Mycetocola reblochoni]|nr:hypothetical protein D9V30_00690 [Mycetocola reblochoni]
METTIGLGAVAGYVIASVVVYLLAAVALWKVLDKAGQPGWVAFIPVVSYLFVLRAVQRPWWWFLLMMIPVVNIVLAIIVAVDLARVFGFGAVFGFFLLFWLPIIGYLVIGFGSAAYRPSERPATW